MAGTQKFNVFDNAGLSFLGYPKTVTVLPSIFKQMNQSMVKITQMTFSSVKIAFSVIDAHENTISSIENVPCSYFKHERVIYMVGLHKKGDQSKHGVN